MEFANRMMLVPFDQSIKSEFTVNTIKNLLIIIIKLKDIDGFDKEYSVKINGKSINEVDIFDVIIQLGKKDGILEHSDQICHLLIKANINPELIENIDIKAKLRSLYSNNQNNEGLFTKKSPIDYRINKNESKINWIK